MQEGPSPVHDSYDIAHHTHLVGTPGGGAPGMYRHPSRFFLFFLLFLLLLEELLSLLTITCILECIYIYIYIYIYR